jgi:RecB family exonuclease
MHPDVANARELQKNVVSLPLCITETSEATHATSHCRKTCDTGKTPEARMTDPAAKPHISFTQVSMYLRCSMQYYYRYVRGLKTPPALALGVGSGGHAALEANGKYKIVTGDDMIVSDLLDLANDSIEAATADLEDPSEIYEKPKAKDNAIAAIRVFRERDAPSIIPAGVEVPFSLDINAPDKEPVRAIVGKIDLITTTGGIEDYKFTGRMKPQSDVDLSPQLTLYGKVFQTLTGKYPANLGYRMFFPGKTGGKNPRSETETIYRSKELMDPNVQQNRFNRLDFQFRGVEHGIKNEVFVPTDNPQTCAWCGYRERCHSSLVNDYEAAKIRGETT